MKKFLFFILAALLIVSAVGESSSKEINNNYCSIFHADIDKVFVAYNQDITGGNQYDWERTINNAIRAEKKWLQDSGVEIDFIDKIPETITNDNALYVDFVYSYVSGNAFSIHTEEDFIVSWINMFRLVPKGMYKGQVVRESSKKNFYPITDISKIDPTALTIASYRLFTSDACAILSFSKNKKCTNPKNVSKNTIVPHAHSCVFQESKDDLIIFYEQNKLRKALSND